jgi:hypothetical protein
VSIEGGDWNSHWGSVGKLIGEGVPGTYRRNVIGISSSACVGTHRCVPTLSKDGKLEPALYAQCRCKRYGLSFTWHYISIKGYSAVFF